MSPAHGAAPLIDVARGTDEPAWRAWLAHSALRAWEPGRSRRVVVVSPHPDDEVLALGGTMAALHRAGTDVVVVAVTDGEASHPSSATWTPDRLRVVRPEEAAAALRCLGLRRRPHRLRLPDGAVAEHEDDLAHLLAPLLDGADWCLAPWRHDGHPDHEAVGRAAVAAGGRAEVRTAEFPVWAWHWAAPGDDRLPWATARAVRLAAGELAAKRRAVEAFFSQMDAGPDEDPVLPRAVLAHFERDIEVVFT